MRAADGLRAVAGREFFEEEAGVPSDVFGVSGAASAHVGGISITVTLRRLVKCGEMTSGRLE